MRVSDLPQDCFQGKPPLAMPESASWSKQSPFDGPD
jgi:hypothetical protein